MGAAREAGNLYGTMAVDLSLVHIGVAVTEEAVQDHTRGKEKVEEYPTEQEAGEAQAQAKRRGYRDL